MPKGTLIIIVDEKPNEWFNGDMALDKNDWKQLDKRFKKQNKEIVSRVVRQTVPEVVKVVIPHIKTVVSLVITKELSEQEEKYEKKLEKFKSDFFNRVDPVLKEVKTAQEERPLIENRLEALEEIHPDGKHLTTS